MTGRQETAAAGIPVHRIDPRAPNAPGSVTTDLTHGHEGADGWDRVLPPPAASGAQTPTSG